MTHISFTSNEGMNEEILALFFILKYFTLQRKLLALTDFQNFTFSTSNV
jgi:hypothetical protein